MSDDRGPSTHPTGEQLSAFLAGEIDESAAAFVEQHIVDCLECCGRLDELSKAGDPLVSALKGAGSRSESTVASDGGLTDAGHGKTDSPAPDLPPGEPSRIGSYTLLGLLGEGGMGRVYKARHERLNRLVALKMIHADRVRDPQFALRFSMEAESVARLRHPNIVQIYDVGRHDNQPYFALELVEGDSLDRAIQRRRPSAREAAMLVKSLADAIHCAHEHGVVHRDLKPANVLLDGPGEDLGAVVPKVADFGIAKQLDADSDLTQTGMIAGTPNYMAPEQVRGQSDQVGPHTDVYALGVILYELLTGQTPFSGATPLDVMNQVLDRDAPAPSSVGSSAPADLTSICLQCLHKEPARRYANAKALADDLGRYLAGETVAARRAGVVERGWRWSRRRPSLAALVVTAALLATVGFPAATLLWLDASRARNRAQRSDAAQRLSSYRANIAAAGSFLQLNNTSAARRALDAAPEELRNWEWRHFHQRLRGANRVISDHEAAVWGIAMSPDGKHIATASADETVKLWNAATGELVTSLAGQDHFSRTPQLEFSPDGRFLVVAGPNNSACVWNVANGELRSSLGGHAFNVAGCVYSHDGSRIVTRAWYESSFRIWNAESSELVEQIDVNSRVWGAVFSPVSLYFAVCKEDGTVGIWDAGDGEHVASWSAHEAQVSTARFSPDGEFLATAGDYGDNNVKLWRAPLGEPVATFEGHDNGVLTIDFSPDGAILASGEFAGTIAWWDTQTRELRTMSHDHDGPINQVLFSPDGDLLASASRDQTVRLWDPTTGGQVAVMHGHSDAVHSLAFDPQGNRVVSTSLDSTVAFWDVASRRRTGVLRGHSESLGDVAFSPDGTTCASASWDGTVRVWDVAMEEETRRLTTDDPVATGVAYHPSGAQLAAVDRNSLTVWDLESGNRLLREPLAVGNWPDRRVAISPDGRLMVTGTLEGNLLWWSADDWRNLGPTPGHDDACRDVAFSPDSKYLASASEDHTVGLWDAASRVRTARLTCDSQPATCVAFDQTGSMLAAGSESGAVRIWNTNDNQQLAVLNHGTRVYDVAFHPNGERLAVACDNHTIRLWDVATWTEVGQLLGHDSFVWALAFSPDGTRLLSGSGDDTLRIWSSGSIEP